MGIPLKDLEPKDIGPGRVLVFECPCTNHGIEGKCFGRIRIPILPEPNGWKLESGSFAKGNMTLSPSILIHPSGDPVGSFCAGWHRFLRNGVLEPC